jgi:hypothetical protein
MVLFACTYLVHEERFAFKLNDQTFDNIHRKYFHDNNNCYKAHKQDYYRNVSLTTSNRKQHTVHGTGSSLQEMIISWWSGSSLNLYNSRFIPMLTKAPQ